VIWKDLVSIFRYNGAMVTYRKELVICLIALTAIGTVTYSLLTHHQPPTQSLSPVIAIKTKHVAEESDGGVNLAATDTETSINSIETTTDQTTAQPVMADVPVTLSGWVGTEFGDYVIGELVTLHSPGLRLHFSTLTDDKGSYRLTEIKPGRDYILKLTPTGPFKPYYRSPINLRYNEEAHNIVLEAIPHGLLSGTITDPYDSPVASVELLIYTNDTDSWTSRVVSDAAGTFNLYDFPQGRFHIKSRHQQNLLINGLHFDPGSSQPLWLVIDLGPHSVFGRVHDESGRAFDGVELSLYWEQHDNDIKFYSTRIQSADADGRFEFTDIGPGAHVIIISAWRGKTFKRTVIRQVNVGVDSGELTVVLDTQKGH
jgi:hypothetical protein